jgi:hypothetical protein
MTTTKRKSETMVKRVASQVLLDAARVVSNARFLESVNLA